MEKSSEKSSFDKSEKKAFLKQSVLVIDDCSDTLDLQRILLEAEGFEVFTAQSGTEALELLSKIDQPNLILLDMQIGDMTGTDFLIRLEAKLPEIIKNVPVVFMTGMDAVPESKAIGFIRKPADMDKFIIAVHQFIEMGKQ